MSVKGAPSGLATAPQGQFWVDPQIVSCDHDQPISADFPVCLREPATTTQNCPINVAGCCNLGCPSEIHLNPRIILGMESAMRGGVTMWHLLSLAELIPRMIPVNPYKDFFYLLGKVYTKSCLFSLSLKTTCLEGPQNLVVTLWRSHCISLSCCSQ